MLVSLILRPLKIPQSFSSRLPPNRLSSEKDIELLRLWELWEEGAANPMAIALLAILQRETWCFAEEFSASSRLLLLINIPSYARWQMLSWTDLTLALLRSSMISLTSRRYISTRSKRGAVLQGNHKSMMIATTRILYAMLSVEFHTNTPNLPWKSSSVNPNLIISSSISLRRLLPGATRHLKTEKEKTRPLLFPTNK